MYHYYHIYIYYDIYDLNPLFSINLRLAVSHCATVLDSAVLIIQYVSDLLNGSDSQSDPADFWKASGTFQNFADIVFDPISDSQVQD